MSDNTAGDISPRDDVEQQKEKGESPCLQPEIVPNDFNPTNIAHGPTAQPGPAFCALSEQHPLCRHEPAVAISARDEKKQPEHEEEKAPAHPIPSRVLLESGILYPWPLPGCPVEGCEEFFDDNEPPSDISRHDSVGQPQPQQQQHAQEKGYAIPPPPPPEFQSAESEPTELPWCCAGTEPCPFDDCSWVPDNSIPHSSISARDEIKQPKHKQEGEEEAATFPPVILPPVVFPNDISGPPTLGPVNVDNPGCSVEDSSPRCRAGKQDEEEKEPAPSAQGPIFAPGVHTGPGILPCTEAWCNDVPKDEHASEISARGEIEQPQPHHAKADEEDESAAPRARPDDAFIACELLNQVTGREGPPCKPSIAVDDDTTPDISARAEIEQPQQQHAKEPEEEEEEEEPEPLVPVSDIPCPDAFCLGMGVPAVETGESVGIARVDISADLLEEGQWTCTSHTKAPIYHCCISTHESAGMACGYFRALPKGAELIEPAHHGLNGTRNGTHTVSSAPSASASSATSVRLF